MSVSTFRLLFATEEPPDIRIVSKIVAKALKVPRADASRMVRYNRGTLLTDLEEDVAREIATRLGEEGIPMLVLADALAKPLPETKRIAIVEFEEDALVLGSTYDPEWRHPIPWEGLVFCSVGWIVEREYTLDFAASTEFDQMVKLKDAQERGLLRDRVVEKVMTRDLTPAEADREALMAGNVEADEGDDVHAYLDIVLSRAEVRLRMKREDFNFSGLGEELSGSSKSNFQILVRRIAERSAAERSPVLERFLQSGEPGENDYFESMEEFEKYTAWSYHKSLVETGVVAPDEDDEDDEAREPDPEGDFEWSTEVGEDA